MSVFTKIKEDAVFVKPAPAFSPLQRLAATPVSGSTYPPRGLIKMEDVDQLGEDLAKKTNATTQKIISKMSANSFDELGQILVTIQTEADKLSPASYSKPGIIGWFKSKFQDVRKELTLNFKSAEQVFTNLEGQISSHIAVHREWIKDLETLYQENFTRYQEVLEIIKRAEGWEQLVQDEIRNWPAIDPNAMDAQMQAQAKVDKENLLRRISIKKDYFIRLKTILENHAPRIRNQQGTSATTISTLKDVVEQAIPAIKAEFTLFLQTLDSKKSGEMVDSLRTLVNTSLKKSADSAKDAAILSATNMNTPTFQTETITHIRTKMLETLSEVSRIHNEGATKRVEDQKYITESQAEYLKALTNQTAI